LEARTAPCTLQHVQRRDVLGKGIVAADRRTLE
jgi:hypothetical protein